MSKIRVKVFYLVSLIFKNNIQKNLSTFLISQKDNFYFLFRKSLSISSLLNFK